MRLDIALVGLLGLEAALNNYIRARKTSVHIAVAKFATIGNVRWPVRLRVSAFGIYRLVQERRVWLNGFVNINNVRQNIVLDIYEFQRLTCGPGVDGSHGLQ